MSRHYFVDDVELDDVTVTGAVRNGEMQGLVSSAFGGDTGTSAITIDDRSGAVELKGFQRFHVTEDACTPARVWTGYISARRVGRSDMYDEPTARRWDCDLMDLNFLLGLRICRGVGANRPAEDDTDRVAWLMTTTFMVGAGPGIFDNGFVTTAEGLPYDESDYRKQYPSQVLESIIGRRRTYFVYYDESAPAGQEVSLFYGNHADVLGELDVKISNVDADIDDDDDPQTTFAMLDGQQLTRNPEDLYDGILFDWKGADIYRQRPETFAEFGIHRDLLYSTDRVGLLSTANTQVDRLLIAHSIERDRLVGTLHLLPSQVNWFPEGYRVQIKQTHLPGYEDYVWTTIQKRTVHDPPEGFDRYRVTLEMTNDAPEGGPGGGDPGGFPLPPTVCADGTAEQVWGESHAEGGGVEIRTFTTAETPAEGNTRFIYAHRRGTVAIDPPIGFADCGEGAVNPAEEYGAVFFRINQPGDSAEIEWAGGTDGPHLIYVEERVGQITPVTSSLVSTDPYNVGSPFPGAPITPLAGRLGAIVAYWFAKRDHGALSADTGWTLLEAATTDSVTTHAVIEKVVSSTSGTYTPSFTGANPAVYDNHSYGAITLALLCDASGEDNPPAPGQWVPWTLVTLVAGAGTTQFPFADGSLEVRYDIVDQTAAIVSYDGATGAFQMPSQPPLGTQVFVRYQGR